MPPSCKVTLDENTHPKHNGLFYLTLKNSKKQLFEIKTRKHDSYLALNAVVINFLTE